MPGYTKAQLTKKKIDPASYRWCRHCRLYWHLRAKHAHSVALPTSTKPKSPAASAEAGPEEASLSDREKEFIDWLVDQELKRWFAENKP